MSRISRELKNEIESLHRGDYDRGSWGEDFDEWSNHVWAEDEDGNTVMLHD